MKAKSHVILKSSKNGIQLDLDPAAPFDTILSETAARFREGKEFFKRATVALYFKGRVLSDGEENSIINIINENSDLNIICLIKEDPATEEIYVQALEAVETLNKDLADDEWTEHFSSDNSLKDLSTDAADTDTSAPRKQEFEIHAGDLTNNTVLDSHSSLIILGNIDRTSAAAADGSLIVAGKLLGTAVAGRRSDPSGCFVAALDMDPVKLSIGNVSMKNGLFGDRRPKGHSDMIKAAYVHNGRIVFTLDSGEIRSILS